MKKLNFVFLLQLFALFLYSTTSIAQGKLAVKTDAQQIVIGDQLHYFITATIDSTKDKILWASLPDTFNGLECVEKGKIDTLRQGTIITYKQRILITGFDSGSFLIPRFLFLSQDKMGKIDSLFTDSFRLMVNTVAVDTSKPFKTIKNVVSVETSWKDYLLLIVGSLVGLGILLWVVLYFLRNKKMAQIKKIPEKEETLQERTLRLLAQLDAQQLWQNDQVKTYYTQLSEIVRHYIEHRFQTPAMELTTEELLRKAKKHKEMTAYRQSLRPLLEAADLAKFAKAVPSPEEHIEAMELAVKFVKASQPLPIHNNPTQNSPKQ